jgi:hypothetical protein
MSAAAVLPKQPTTTLPPITTAHAASPLPRPGCVLPWATNYDPTSNVANGSCVVVGAKIVPSLDS